MQRASHKTRAYYIKSNGLSGFLTLSINTLLRKAEANNDLQQVSKHQVIDMKDILRSLEGMENNEAKIAYLGEKYPCLCMYVR